MTHSTSKCNNPSVARLQFFHLVYYTSFLTEYSQVLKFSSLGLPYCSLSINFEKKKKVLLEIYAQIGVPVSKIPSFVLLHFNLRFFFNFTFRHSGFIAFLTSDNSEISLTYCIGVWTVNIKNHSCWWTLYPLCPWKQLQKMRTEGTVSAASCSFYWQVIFNFWLL